MGVPSDDGLWGVVEIMGHRTRAGLLSDVSIGGATMLRIEHPTRSDHTGEGPVEEFYAPSAIFAIRPCSREEATTVAGMVWPEPRAALGRAPLPHELEEMVDAQLEDDDDEPEEPW